jgi:hypothetical protein
LKCAIVCLSNLEVIRTGPVFEVVAGGDHVRTRRRVAKARLDWADRNLGFASEQSRRR